MSLKSVLISIGVAMSVLALAVVAMLWVTSVQSTEDPRGGIPQLTEAQVQEFATAQWWNDLPRDEQVKVCLNSHAVGENTFKDLAEDNDLNPEQLWKFITRECDL